MPLQPPVNFLCSDASDHACISFIDNEYNNIFHQNWSPAESSKSSTWRKLRTVVLALSAFAPDLQGKRVAWITDNTSVVAIVQNGTLVIPIWKSSYFWVLLCDDGKHWNEFVHDWVILPKYKHLFIRGNAKNHVFDSKDLSFTVIALRLNFKQPRTQSFSGSVLHR